MFATWQYHGSWLTIRRQGQIAKAQTIQKVKVVEYPGGLLGLRLWDAVGSCGMLLTVGCCGMQWSTVGSCRVLQDACMGGVDIVKCIEM